MGVDPYIGSESRPVQGVVIRNEEIGAIQDAHFDLIMFHHSLEHIKEHAGTLAAVKRLLSRGGTCLVRMPMADSEPAQRYGVNWVDWDAPRHCVLHSERSFRMLAEQHGLRVYHVEQEVSPFPYWGSELYRRGLSLSDRRSSTVRDPLTHFSEREMRGFEECAERAAAEGRSGRAALYLCHEGDGP